MTVGQYVLLGRTPHIGYFGFETSGDRRVCAELLESPRPHRHGGAATGHALRR